MPTSNERRELIQKIKSLPEKLEAVVEGLSEAQLDTPYRDGGWTPRQVVHHLCDSHMNAFLRFKWMLNEEKTLLKTYNQDVWAQSKEYSMHILGSLALLRGLHERWSFLLESIPEEGWNRTAMHPENGEMTLDRMLTIYGNHGEKHCMQIKGLRDKMKW
jgi:hypothetical protein